MDPRPLRHGCLALVALLSLVCGAASQQRWSLALTRLGDGERIDVDGDIRESAWRGAARLSPLVQVDPVEGARPTQPTVVRICYDRNALYLAFECREEPSQVRGRLMQRDANLDPEDRIEFWIDTFNDRRSAYWFQIGAGGSKGDALIGGGRFNKSWDGIWLGRAKITGAGWQAEVAIPFKTVSFDPNGDTWRFNLRRERKANDEESRWAAPYVAYQFFSILQGGTLTGLHGLRQGVGLDIVPYAKVSASRDRRTDKHTSRLGDAGLDLNYRLTPALTLRLTYNTDFAETEVDQRQSNLTRFPLFFPEKRDFFLEDAGLFEFGPSSRRPSVIPFFSRRLGRDDTGAAIPIIAGAKLTGRLDGWDLGVLDIFQDEHVDGDGKASDDRSLGVVRVSRNFGRENSVGMIATTGRPTDSGSATTTGIDFRLGDSRAFGEGRGYEISGWWLDTQLAGPGGDDNAYGLEMEYDSKEWELDFNQTHIEADFAPALGFVRRTDTREYRGRVEYTWRDEDGGFLRRWSPSFAPRVITTERGSRDSWDARLTVGDFTFESDDGFRWDVRRSHDRLRQGFEIREGVIIPPGDYTVTSHSLGFETSARRWAYLSVDTRFGGFFNGSLTQVEIEPNFILGRHVQVSAAYEQNHVVLDQGRFTTRIWSGRVDLSVSPRLTLRNLVQYDSDSKNLTAQSRLRWIHEPGRELFLVGLYGWERAAHGEPLIPTTQEVALKVLYTLRF